MTRATSPESRLVGAPIQTVPDRVRAASPLTYVTGERAAVPHHARPGGQLRAARTELLLYEALAKAGNDVTLRLIDGLPHTFFNRSNLDELAGPFRMDVREHPRRGVEATRVDRAGVFDVARAFFTKHLR